MLSGCRSFPFTSDLCSINFEFHTTPVRLDELTFRATWDENGSYGVLHLKRSELEEFIISAGSHNREHFASILIEAVVIDVVDKSGRQQSEENSRS
jgi:hypothetical protein